MPALGWPLDSLVEPSWQRRAPIVRFERLVHLEEREGQRPSLRLRPTGPNPHGATFSLELSESCPSRPAWPLGPALKTRSVQSLCSSRRFRAVRGRALLEVNHVAHASESCWSSSIEASKVISSSCVERFPRKPPHHQERHLSGRGQHPGQLLEHVLLQHRTDVVFPLAALSALREET